MASNDYAIVVGINDYPGMNATPAHSRDLEGPINDAEAIHAWLIDPAKGAVPPANARLICSPRPLPRDFTTGNAVPVTKTIVHEFRELSELAAKSTPPLGRRLYVYMSGHGFAPERAKGAVFVADATDLATEHVFATAWVNWFYNAAYFEELVLWLDCCMTYHFTVVPQPPTLRIVQGNSAASRLFTAYSAKFKQRSAEGLMPDGLVHGAFTYTLLQALASAVDADGDITTASIKQYLINRMRDNVPDQFNDISDVAREPDFGFDEPMVFLKGAPIPSKEVPLDGLPDGTSVDILGGNPSAKVASVVVQQGKVHVALRPGVYVARVRGRANLYGFQV
jgi:uncharacterized caspase-like protein